MLSSNPLRNTKLTASCIDLHSFYIFSFLTETHLKALYAFKRFISFSTVVELKVNVLPYLSRV